MNTIPIPHDIPLPLPADRGVLEAVIVVLYLLHILFVNMMVGGSVLGVIFEVLGLWRKDYDRLAHAVASTITVNKSLAVVLGVGPLLAINVLYTVYFYTANALTGGAWILIVPLVTAAFLASYLWKYSWERLADSKGLHLGIGMLSALLFLIIPFIFLTNINLMLFPARWTEVAGFLSAMVLPNVLVRYLHFLVASFAISGLFFVLWFTRKGFPVGEHFESLDRPALRRIFYGVTFGATLTQFIVGPTLLLSLPVEGMSWLLVAVISCGVSLAIVATWLLWREISTHERVIGRHYVAIITLITWTAFFMGYGRHLYREKAIEHHRGWVAEHTAQYEIMVHSADALAAAGGAGGQVSAGEQVFNSTCSSCHAVDKVLVGPPLTEIAKIYAGNPEGIVKWTQAPGKKRAGFPSMPAFKLPREKLQAVAELMIVMGSGEKEEEPALEPGTDG